MSPDNSERKRDAAEVLKRFSSARKLVTLYPPEHPEVQKSIETLVKASGQLLESFVTFTLSVVGGEIYLAGTLMPEASETHSKLIEDLAERKLVNISVDRGVTPEEWTTFIAWSAKKPETIE